MHAARHRMTACWRQRPSQRLGVHVYTFVRFSSKIILAMTAARCLHDISQCRHLQFRAHLSSARRCGPPVMVILGHPARYMGEDGEMRRPWCPATRVLEHREAQRVQAEAERRRSTAMQQALRGPARRQPRTDFPPLQAGSGTRCHAPWLVSRYPAVLLHVACSLHGMAGAAHAGHSLPWSVSVASRFRMHASRSCRACMRAHASCRRPTETYACRHARAACRRTTFIHACRCARVAWRRSA